MGVVSDLSTAHLVILTVSVAIAFGFEVVNGFHDAATAVASVIYTRTLRPVTAVVWSGIWNGLGVLYAMATGLGVAFSIVHLLPVDLLVSMGTSTGLVMVFSLLAAAMLWNLGTWYLGLPVSSSHTLIGSVLGVGVASAWMSGRPIAQSVNWAKAAEVFRALVVSPVVGFVCAGVLLLVMARISRDPQLHDAPSDARPPLWIRAALILSSTGVSFAHGSNDGQKGIGLIMLVLMGTLPAFYALDLTLDRPSLSALHRSLDDADRAIAAVVARSTARDLTPNVARPQAHADWNHVTLTADPIAPSADAIRAHIALVHALVPEGRPLGLIPAGDRWRVRQELLRLSQAIGDFARMHEDSLREAEAAHLRAGRDAIRPLTEFAPRWIGFGVAACLGFGSMIGWRRVAITVGEKIGHRPMSLAQGAAAQVTAMATILAADRMGLPVSTTHVLSGGVAGTMVAAQVGLQRRTLTSIATAWVVTLPSSMALSASLYVALTTGLPVAASVLGPAVR